MKTPLEKEAQLAICHYLQLNKHFFWRANTTPVFDTKDKKFRSMPKYAKKGVPDIILVQKGIFIGLEVKRVGNRQNEAQIEFQKGLEKAGGKYHVVYSVDDVIALGL